MDLLLWRMKISFTTTTMHGRKTLQSDDSPNEEKQVYGDFLSYTKSTSVFYDIYLRWCLAHFHKSSVVKYENERV